MTLEKLYKVEENAKEFIRHHEYLILILKEARAVLERYFIDCEVKLEETRCPECGCPHTSELVATVLVTEKYYKTAFDTLNIFFEEWWKNNCDRAKGNLSFSLEYV